MEQPDWKKSSGPGVSNAYRRYEDAYSLLSSALEFSLWLYFSWELVTPSPFPSPRGEGLPPQANL